MVKNILISFKLLNLNKCLHIVLYNIKFILSIIFGYLFNIEYNDYTQSVLKITNILLTK